MDKISLLHVLPDVFFDIRETLVSEIWQTEVILEKGKKYLIEAASGTGKSSFCSYLYGYRNDYSGNILFDRTDIRDLSMLQWTVLRRHSLSLLFQELRLFPELTAWENVEIKNHLTNHKTDTEIKAYFEVLGIPEKVNARVGKMSFGQQQRVAFIRSLCQPFDFIFLDEPISHLDEANGRIITSLLLEEAERQGAGIVVTSIGKHLDMVYDKIVRL